MGAIDQGDQYQYNNDGGLIWDTTVVQPYPSGGVPVVDDGSYPGTVLVDGGVQIMKPPMVVLEPYPVPPGTQTLQPAPDVPVVSGGGGGTPDPVIPPAVPDTAPAIDYLSLVGVAMVFAAVVANGPVIGLNEKLVVGAGLGVLYYQAVKPPATTI